MRPDTRSAAPLSRPRSDIPVRERRTLRGRIQEGFVHARAIQIKLNELLAVAEGASNRLINVETMSDDELDRLQRQFQHLADRLRARGQTKEAHSIEEENGPGPPGPSPGI